MIKIFPGDILMVLGLAFFLSATVARLSDKYMGTAIKQVPIEIGRMK